MLLYQTNWAVMKNKRIFFFFFYFIYDIDLYPHNPNTTSFYAYNSIWLLNHVFNRDSYT